MDRHSGLKDQVLPQVQLRFLAQTSIAAGEAIKKKKRIKERGTYVAPGSTGNNYSQLTLRLLAGVGLYFSRATQAKVIMK